MLNAWCDHVVHVDLVSDDLEIAQACADLIRGSVPAGADVAHQSGGVQVRSASSDPVTAPQVLQALQAAAVRVHALHERDEWSVGA